MLFFRAPGPVVDPLATTSSSKKPEFFWPRQVLRKLLKLKPVSDEFNADELDEDEEEDSEDEFDLSDSSEEKRGLSSRASLPPLHPNTPDRTKHSHGNIFRGQSETLWTQFVDMQDYRIHVGTWNVAGRSPSPDLDLREWLEVNPATDIYVIGLQEVVPLNAGNVFGNADESPPAKWDALIRKTLNANHRRAMSAPPSPAVSPPAAEKTDEELEEEEEVEDDKQQMFQQGACSSLSHSTSMNFTSSSSSSSSKIKKVGHRRTHSAYEQSSCSLLSSSSKLPSAAVAEQVNGNTCCNSPAPEQVASPGGPDNYVRIVSKQMVGVYISVWIRKALRRYVHHLKVSCVGCGLMNYCGNKGSIAVSLLLHQTSFCFVCTHLTSGEKEGDELRRNADVTEILRRTSFMRSPRAFNVDLPETILQHERVIWLGDLNYRLSMSDGQTRALVAKEDWQTLLEKDQLKLEQNAGRVFEGWQEGAIVFPPTYKYLKGSDLYFGENSRPGDKRRTPSWCDRILFRGRGLKQISYARKECRFSDHRPVNAVFIAEVEAFSNRKLRTVARLANPVAASKSLGSCNEEELEKAVDFIRSLKQQQQQHDESGSSVPCNLTQAGLKPKKMTSQVAVH